MGIGVDDSEIIDMAYELNCGVGSFPFTYLGLPVGGMTSRIRSWQHLIKKFRNRLSLWKSRHLSFGGRLILCKSVLGGLGNYLFFMFKAHKSVTKVQKELVENSFGEVPTIYLKFHGLRGKRL